MPQRSRLQSLLNHLTRAAGVTHAFVGRFTLERTPRVQILAATFAVSGEWMAASETPWNELREKPRCTVAAGVRAAYPDDPLLAELGAECVAATTLPRSSHGTWIAAVDVKPFANTDLVHSMLDLVAEAAAATAVTPAAAPEVPTPMHAPIRTPLSTCAVPRDEAVSPRLAAALDVAAGGLWEWDLDAQELYCSERWCELLGLPAVAVRWSPNDWLSRVHEEDRERLSAELEQAQRQGARVDIEYRVAHADGEWRRMRVSAVAVREPPARPRWLVGWQTALEGESAPLHAVRLGRADALTGLPTRTVLLERIQRALDATRNDGRRGCSLLLLDVDDYQVVSASLGHEAGSLLLLKLAQRISESIRPSDVASRVDSDEFGILLLGVSEPTDALTIARRIQRSLATPFDIKGQEIFITASVGIATSDAGYDEAADLLRDADAAMYGAKGRGGKTCEIFSPVMRRSVVARLRTEAELRRAVERGEFELMYQPIVSTNDGRVRAFEALLRWRHPDRGLLAPRDFLGSLQASGLIVPVGHWVLREACRQSVAWREQCGHEVAVTVNIGPKQLDDRRFAQEVMDIARDTGADPTDLVIEITEETLVENMDHVSAVLRHLRQAGARVLLDDFGTGYSSLNYLQQLPVDGLKIDRCFVGQIASDEGRRGIVKTIVDLAHQLELEVVAEGVERAEQVDVLRAIGCDHLQGYLIAPPSNLESAWALLQGKGWKRLSS